MKHSIKEIANYIHEKINLSSNSAYNIYDGPNGLTHTTGSMEYRDENYQHVTTYITMDDVLYDDDLINSLVFQLDLQYK
jgi:hypothetical protein